MSSVLSASGLGLGVDAADSGLGLGVDVAGGRSLPCRMCGDEVDEERWELGYRVCLFCGEEVAVNERKTLCVVPMAKSNYVYVQGGEQGLALLKGLNKYNNG